MYDITLGGEGTINNEANDVANRILRTRQRIFLLFLFSFGIRISALLVILIEGRERLSCLVLSE